MSTLKTHNLQSPDAGSVNISLAPNAGMVVAGLSTYSNQINVGSSIKLGNAGVITATSFVGSGANLTGIDTDLLSDTSPQLGADLDVNNFNIKNGTAILDITTNQRFEFNVAGTEVVDINGGGVDITSGHVVLVDNVKAKFGSSGDMEIYHDGTDNYIRSNNGAIILRDDTIQLKAYSTTDTYLSATNGGGVSLRYDNGVKFVTTNTGAIVTGILTATAFKGDMVPATYHGGRRNMFINGDFIVSQRGDRDPHANQNNGANNLGYGGPDHVQVVSNLGAYYARQKNSGSAPRTQAGATCSYELDVTTANASPGSNAYTFLNVMWNGNEAGRLLYGTSNARPVTISFWCYSNKTGNFVINMRNYSTDRQINQVVSISSSNTWEYKTVTFVGDTASAISATLDARWAIEFWLDAGTDYTSGSNQSVWGTRVDNRRASGCTLAIASSTSNYFRMALLQVEMGPYATPFEFRTYSEYLHDCEYYFQKPHSARGSNQAFAIHIWGHKIADTYALRVQTMMRPTEMRINPTDYFHDNNPSGLTAQRYQTQGSDYEYTYNVGMSIGSNKKEFANGTKYPYGVNGMGSAESGILFAYDFESYAEL